MTIHEDLVATVGPAVGGRFYANVAPSNAAFPYAVYSLVSATPTQVLEGEITPTNWIFQIDAFATQKSAVAALGTAIRAAMNAATLYKSTCTMVLDDYEEEAKLYRVTLDFSVWKVGE